MRIYKYNQRYDLIDKLHNLLFCLKIIPVGGCRNLGETGHQVAFVIKHQPVKD